VRGGASGRTQRAVSGMQVDRRGAETRPYNHVSLGVTQSYLAKLATAAASLS
jgi:hypothetical protein